MRARAAVAAVLLMLPVALDAQRLPRTRRPGPTTPAELPPQPGEIAREMSYKRLPFAFESYPTFAVVRAAGFVGNGITSSWNTVGVGTRADYRVMRYVSATLDMTSSMFGGPVRLETIELGTRLRPDRDEHRIYPFVDIRYGFMQATHSNMGVLEGLSGVTTAQQFSSGAQYSRGTGYSAGGGAEVALGRAWSITTAVAFTDHRMNAFGYQGLMPTDDTYRMKTVRFAAGVRFNPVRLIMQ